MNSLVCSFVFFTYPRQPEESQACDNYKINLFQITISKKNVTAIFVILFFPNKQIVPTMNTPANYKTLTETENVSLYIASSSFLQNKI